MDKDFTLSEINTMLAIYLDNYNWINNNRIIDYIFDEINFLRLRTRVENDGFEYVVENLDDPDLPYCVRIWKDEIVYSEVGKTINEAFCRAICLYIYKRHNYGKGC